MRRVPLVLLVVLAAPSVVSAQTEATLEGMFAAANRAAWARDYEGAAWAYQEIVDAGVEDADVYYNLATVCLLGNRLGQAMRFYERVLRLRPGDEDALHNLGQARSLLGRKLAGRAVETRPSPGREVLAFFTLDGAAWTFLVFWCLAWTLVLVRRSIPGGVRRLATGVVLPILAGLALLSGVVLLGKVHYERRGREAIVIADEQSLAKGGPGSEYPDAFGVNEGERVEVLAREARWVLVRLRDGREAWLRRVDVGTI